MNDANRRYDKVSQMGDVRSRIVEAATALIRSGGRDAATTRAVADAAGVQAPTLYRLFGDKRGLLDAAAEHGFAAYVAEKANHKRHPDPVQELRNGWDMHVEFGLANPGLFSIMAGDPQPGHHSPAAAAGLNVLRQRIQNIALAGRLRVSETRALLLLQSVGTGTVLTLLGQPEDLRDLKFSETAREAVIASITNDGITPIKPGPSAAAATLHAFLDQTSVLTLGERHLMEELLQRIADGDHLSQSAAKHITSL